jgi:hypothetical protein
MKSIAQTSREIPADLIGPIYPVFDGATAQQPQLVELRRHTIKSAPEVELWAIQVGETGTGRWLASLLVDRPMGSGETRYVQAAQLRETRSGGVKLVAYPPERASQDAAIIVLRLRFGYRGGVSYTGDLTMDEHGQCTFAADPSIVLAEGTIADGAAGRAASAHQRIVLLRRGDVLRTASYSDGRSPSEIHYWIFDGARLHRRAWTERDIDDVYPAFLASEAG